MKNFLPLYCTLCVALVTAGCGPTVEPPDIKQNPHPKVRYDVTMTIDDAPGPFDSIEARVQYQVMNSRCVPMLPGSGATPTLSKAMPLSLVRLDERTYRGSFFADLLQDEDYYGMGICHWEFIATSAALKVNSTTFRPTLFMGPTDPEKSSTRYFAGVEYENAARGEFNVIGAVKSPYITGHPDEFFSVSLTARRELQ